MKKRILFLCSNMGIGGFQKSLVSLLQYFDYEKYDVSLLLFRPEGIFMSLIPEEVHIIEPPITPTYLEGIKVSIKGLWQERKFGLLIWRAISGLAFGINKGVGAWLMSRGIPKIKGNFDVAIDYNGQHILYYMIDNVVATKKYTFFHSDYIKWKFYALVDRIYYKKADAIVSVSDECVNSLKTVFPEDSNKIFCVENIIADKTVSTFPINSNSFTDDYGGKRLVTVGRVCMDKGIDFALEACHILKERGKKFRWYWVGPCNDFSDWEQTIEKYQLQQYFVFLGPTNNPYDYMRNAYLIVHPSRFEGKAVAVEEAKVLGIPVVATNYSTVGNQIIDGSNGSIVQMNATALADGLEKYLDQPELREIQHKYLKEHPSSNETEIEKIYHLIETNVVSREET